MTIYCRAGHAQPRAWVLYSDQRGVVCTTCRVPVAEVDGDSVPVWPAVLLVVLALTVGGLFGWWLLVGDL